MPSEKPGLVFRAFLFSGKVKAGLWTVGRPSKAPITKIIIKSECCVVVYMGGQAGRRFQDVKWVTTIFFVGIRTLAESRQLGLRITMTPKDFPGHLAMPPDDRRDIGATPAWGGTIAVLRQPEHLCTV